MPNRPVLTSPADGVRLVPIDREHTADIVRWRNSPAVAAHLFGSDLLTPEIHGRWLEEYVLKGKCCQFIIYGHDCPIGTVFLKNIDPDHRKAEFGIFIGETVERGKGYGAAATRLITDFGFTELKLNKIYLLVFAENRSAIRCYQKAGFREEGVLLQEYRKDGRFINVVRMAKLKES